jgi:hypothetical protein
LNYRMVHFSEIESLRVSLQFLAFSEAYLYSAACLCDVLASSPEESSFPQGAVVLSLSFHGIELFLKAAILEKVPEEKFCGKSGHDLESLGKRYANLYRSKKFAFKVPFGTEETNPDQDPCVIEKIEQFMSKHKRDNPADQLNRYPRNIEGEPWDGIYAFEPNSFATVIAKAQQDVARLKGLIFN